MTLEEALAEIQKLRDENAKHRLKNKELSEEVATVKAERDKVAAEKDSLSQSVVKLTEDAEKTKTELTAKIDEASKSASEKIKAAEVAALAIKEGLVDRDALKLADLSKVEIDESGNLKGADDVIKALKESKPYLFGTASSSSNPEKKPPPEETETKKATEMTKEEYDKAKQELLKPSK